MRDLPFVRDIRLGPASMSPNRRSSVFGLTTNFLETAYSDYVVTTGRNELKTELGSAQNNIVSEMIEGQGKIRLLGETTEDDNDEAKPTRFSIVPAVKGILPTCATAREKSNLFLRCQYEGELITNVKFARYGIPNGVCNDVDGSNTFVVSDTCDAGTFVQEYFAAMCIGRSSCGASATKALFGDPCPGVAKSLSVAVECGTRDTVDLQKAISLEPPPMNYIDAIVSQALTDYCSININTPFGLRIKTGYELPGAKSFLLNLVGKPRAFVSKAPGFLFSSYQILSWNAPLLIPLEQYTNLVFKAYDLSQNFDFTPVGAQQNQAPTTNASSPSSTGKNETSERIAQLKKVGVNPYQKGTDIPKQRLLVRMKSSSTLLEKAVLINNLMARAGGGISSQFASSVTDTKGLIKETEVATTALNFFLVFISIIIMSLVMLVSSVSFSANVLENAREFAVLRSLGLLRSQTVTVWLLEAVSLTCASFILGGSIGILVASSLTLTQGLFLEIPFFLVLPTLLLCVLFVLSVVVALVASYEPAKLLLKKPIAGVLKG